MPRNVNRQFKSVVTLSIAKNGLRTWDDVKRLGKLFPSLVSLNVSENPIGEIHYPKDDEDIAAARDFPNLAQLNLSECQVDDWTSVETLHQFPCLTEIRIRGCPVYTRKSLTQKQQRYLTVARLPKVVKLNGSPVDGEEREDAERMFIRFVLL